MSTARAITDHEDFKWRVGMEYDLYPTRGIFTVDDPKTMKQGSGSIRLSSPVNHGYLIEDIWKRAPRFTFIRSDITGRNVEFCGLGLKSNIRASSFGELLGQAWLQVHAEGY